MPLLADAPPDVPLTPETERVCMLWFCEDDPLDSWDERWVALGTEHGVRGRGSVVFAAPFVKTIPGTDTYTDQLW